MTDPTEEKIQSVEKMDHELNRQLKVPSFTASALTGEGVGNTLSRVMKLTLQHLQKEFQWAQDK